jgi:hypothetical protein
MLRVMSRIGGKVYEGWDPYSARSCAGPALQGLLNLLLVLQMTRVPLPGFAAAG